MDAIATAERANAPDKKYGTVDVKAEQHMPLTNAAAQDLKSQDLSGSPRLAKTYGHTGKTASDDSEAETEILGASQKNTPLKKPHVQRSNTVDGVLEANTGSPEALSNGTHKEPVAASGGHSQPRKRKVRESEGSDVRRDQRLFNGRRGLQKRARLSQSEDDDADNDETSSSSGSDDDVAGKASNVASNRQSRLRAKQSGDSEGENTISLPRPKRDTLAELDLTASTRRSAAPLSARSQSPRPSLRKRHRRASSFHTPSVGPDRDRRSRRRLDSQDEEGPARSPSTASMPKLPKDIDRNGRTHLARASSEGDTDRVTSILATSANDVDRPDFAGNNPIQLAACNGFTGIVEKLIESGANVNCYNNLGETPLKDAEDNEHEDTIKLLKAAGATLDPPGKTHAAGPKHRHHYHTPSLAKLLEFTKQSDLEGINICFEAGFIPNAECMIAAVRTRNVELVGLLLGLGGPADPAPTRSDPSHTPMLTAVGIGCPEIVELLLDNGCDPRRKLSGQAKTYKEIARERAGPRWREEYRLLSRAYNMSAYKDSLSPTPAPALKSSSPLKAPSKLIPPSVPPSQKDTVKSVSPHVERTAIRQSQPIADPEEQRRQYLAVMPRGFRQALLEGAEKVLYPPKSSDIAKRHLLPVSRFADIITFLRGEIDLDAKPENVDEMWMFGWQASILLGHNRLDKITELKIPTLRIIPEHRELVLQAADIADFLSLDFDYNRIAFQSRFETFCKEHDMPHQLIRATNRPDVVTGVIIDHHSIAKVERQKFLRMPDDQLFWIRVEDFVGMTHPSKTPRLQGFRMRVQEPVRIDLFKPGKSLSRKLPYASENKAPGRRTFQDGAWLPESRPDSSVNKIKVTIRRNDRGKRARTFTTTVSSTTPQQARSPPSSTQEQ